MNTERQIDSNVDSKRIQDFINKAAYCARAADQANKDLQDLFEAALNKAMPIGSIINLREKGRPEYLRTAHVVSGRSHGTSLFRIESAIEAQVSNPEMPHLTTWSCSVTPISEATQKDMSGSPTRGLARGSFAKLSGGVFVDISELTGEEYEAYNAKKVVDFLMSGSDK